MTLTRPECRRAASLPWLERPVAVPSAHQVQSDDHKQSVVVMLKPACGGSGGDVDKQNSEVDTQIRVVERATSSNESEVPRLNWLLRDWWMTLSGTNLLA